LMILFCCCSRQVSSILLDLVSASFVSHFPINARLSFVSSLGLYRALLNHVSCFLR
jgi:hypothetical protein